MYCATKRYFKKKISAVSGELDFACPLFPRHSRARNFTRHKLGNQHFTRQFFGILLGDSALYSDFFETENTQTNNKRHTHTHTHTR